MPLVSIPSRIGVRLNDEIVWSPRAVAANREFVDCVGECLHIGEWLRPIFNVRLTQGLRSSCYLENDRDGVRYGCEPVAGLHGDYLMHVNVATDGDLIVSRMGRRLVVNLITPEFAEHPIRRECQVYSARSLSLNRERPEIVQAFFRSRFYRRYVDCYIEPVNWREDFQNLLLPRVNPQLLASILQRAHDVDKRRRQQVDRLMSISANVSKIYRRELGLRYTSRSFGVPIRQVSASALIGGAGCSARPFNEILRNLRPDSGLIDEGYLEGLFLCDFMPQPIRDVVWHRVPYGYLQPLLRMVVLPVPDVALQHRLYRECLADIDEFKQGMSFLRKLREHDEVSDFIDREVFHAY